MRHILDIIRTLFKDIPIKEAYFIYFNNSQIHHFFYLLKVGQPGQINNKLDNKVLILE